MTEDFFPTTGKKKGWKFLSIVDIFPSVPEEKEKRHFSNNGNTPVSLLPEIFLSVEGSISEGEQNFKIVVEVVVNIKYL